MGQRLLLCRGRLELLARLAVTEREKVEITSNNQVSLKRQLRPNGSKNAYNLLDIRTAGSSGVACWRVNAESQQTAFVMLPSIEPFTSDNPSFVPCDGDGPNGSLRNENRASTVVMWHIRPSSL
ncbi:MAG: hypothetical protein ABI665_27640 [Vicinamibacterales bacterium]